jgi:hypothetical protein
VTAKPLSPALDVSSQAAELMKSGCPEEAAFYWASMIVSNLESVVQAELAKRAAASPALDVERLTRAWKIAVGGYDDEAVRSAVQVLAAEYQRLAEAEQE